MRNEVWRKLLKSVKWKIIGLTTKHLEEWHDIILDHRCIVESKNTADGSHNTIIEQLKKDARAVLHKDLNEMANDYLKRKSRENVNQSTDSTHVSDIITTVNKLCFVKKYLWLLDKTIISLLL